MTWVAVLVYLLLSPTAALVAQTASASTFNNDYLKISVLPGWAIDSSSPPVLKLTHGKYVLIVNPIVLHATAFPTVYQITSEVPSVHAVQEADPSASGTDCAQPHRPSMPGGIHLVNLYTSNSPTDTCCCKFPPNGKSVWFGSYYVGEGKYASYSIAAGFDSAEVNALPDESDPQLRKMLAEIDTMAKSLVLKPPLVITSVDPSSAPPGATITVHGSGFHLPKEYDIAVDIPKFPEACMPPPKIAADGKSLTFQIPTCAVTDDCLVTAPQMSSCDLPFPPGRYEISVTGNEIRSSVATLTVTAAQR